MSGPRYRLDQGLKSAQAVIGWPSPRPGRAGGLSFRWHTFFAFSISKNKHFTMKDSIVFIHGMFQNAKSWAHWVTYFEGLGYECTAINWPFHEGDPADLRENIPSQLGDLRLQPVIDQIAAQVEAMRPQPILVGHSVGGLIVQSLVNRGLGKAGVCVDSVAPNRMLAFDWGFFRNSVGITNPLKGDEPFLMTPEGFQQNFCNTMSEMESDEAYQHTATHDSRNILRDCLLEAGEIDMDLPHVPLLFIGGEKDQIVPPELNEKNANAYTDAASSTEFRAFPHRGHWICGQSGWEEVASYVHDWVTRKVPSREQVAMV